MISRTIGVELLIVVIAGVGFAATPDGLEGLVEQSGEFATVLVRPGIDLSAYTTVVCDPVELEYREVVLRENEPSTGSMIAKRTKRIGAPKRRDVKKTRLLFDEAIAEELSQLGRYRLAAQPGPNTLIVRSSVQDIVTRELAEAGQPTDPDKPPIVRGTIVFDLVDASSGLVQARISERRDVDAAVEADDDGRWGPIATWADDAAADLRHELERIAG